MKLKMLVLTDHSNHSQENSLYALVQAMRKHPNCAFIDVATRGDAKNDAFFKQHLAKALHVSRVDESFDYTADGRCFKTNQHSALLDNYDVVWLRMPPPLTEEFLGFLIQEFPTQFFINNPEGIYRTGSKEFLLRFADLCPPMQVCTDIEQIIEFKKQFPIVLKPFREYGGNGIVRIDGDLVWEGNQQTTFDSFIQKLKHSDFEYLAVKFLENVSYGDKRILVVNGKIIGASLRLPAKDSWICNVAMGGTSDHAKVDEDELEIVERIQPVLSEMGIVFYGLDTLVNDEGKRVLSEINTTSIGGFPQIAKFSGKPLLEEVVNLTWNYIIKTLEKNALKNV